MDAEAVGAKGVDFGVCVLHVLPVPRGHAPNPLLHQSVQPAQHLLAQLRLLLGLVEPRVAQELRGGGGWAARGVRAASAIAVAALAAAAGPCGSTAPATPAAASEAAVAAAGPAGLAGDRGSSAAVAAGPALAEHHQPPAAVVNGAFAMLGRAQRIGIDYFKKIKQIGKPARRKSTAAV